MSYRTETIENAPANTPCGWGQGACGSGQPAVHILLKGLPIAPAGTALCSVHSPFDVREDEGSDMIEITTTEGHYGRTSDVVFYVEGKNVYNRHHPHTVNLYTDGLKELSAGASIISAHPGRPVVRHTVRIGDQIKVDGVIYTITGNRMSDPSLVEA